MKRPRSSVAETRKRALSMLELLSQGFSKLQIAETFGTTTKGVDCSLGRLYKMIGADNGYHAIRISMAMGLFNE